ncbi:hypothetical protein PTKIN_Ptkin15bG0132000 [Pterospermum kingtungense]
MEEMKKKAKKICLEEYMEFLSSHKQLPLTLHSLNQILSIHGFKRILKKELSDVVKTLDVMDPSRSTLKSTISSTASLTKQEIIGDLNRLYWNECCVTSIQSLNSSPSTPTPQSKAKGKGKAKRKRSADSFSSAIISFDSSST